MKRFKDLMIFKPFVKDKMWIAPEIKQDRKLYKIIKKELICETL